MPGKPLDQLPPDPPDQRLDNRWTESKLYQAGYILDWEKRCRDCQEEIRAYRRPAKDHKERDRILVLNAYTLDPHSC